MYRWLVDEGDSEGKAASLAAALGECYATVREVWGDEDLTESATTCHIRFWDEERDDWVSSIPMPVSVIAPAADALARMESELELGHSVGIAVDSSADGGRIWKE